MKSGIGSYTVALPGGVLVSALVAVNALGDVRDPATGEDRCRRAQDCGQPRVRRCGEAMLRGARDRRAPPRNTTLAVVATNARLEQGPGQQTRAVRRLGMARTIYPSTP